MLIISDIVFFIYFHCYLLYIWSFILDLITCLFNFYCFISLIYVRALRGQFKLSYISIWSLVLFLTVVYMWFINRMFLRLILHNYVLAISWYSNMHCIVKMWISCFYIDYWTCILLYCGYWTLNIYYFLLLYRSYSILAFTCIIASIT